jgi:hypothetical protein
MTRSHAATIQTLNVNEGVGGVLIDADKYEAVRKAMLKAVPKSEEGLLFKDLPAAVKQKLPGGEIPGGGSISWYTTVVKLDLEARGELERIPGAKPQRLRRVPRPRRAG